jgi:hypothetical protein
MLGSLPAFGLPTCLANHVEQRACWIVDLLRNNSETVIYVDNVRVPNGSAIDDYLRLQEQKTSERPCLLSFVSPSARFDDVNDLRKVAGSIGYEDFHIYLSEGPDHEFVREIMWTPQVTARAVSADARIVNISANKTSESYDVDGSTLPANTTLVDYLEQKEKQSPRASLVVFLTPSARIGVVENLRKFASKMPYRSFHAYVRDSQDHEAATEVLYGPLLKPGEMRTGSNGPVPWPEHHGEKR